MTRTYSQIVIFVLLLFTGCVSERKEGDAEVGDKVPALTAEIAKKTLLEMELAQIPPGVIVPRPMDEPIEVINVDEIAIGSWNCNLKEKVFRVSAFYPKAKRHRFNHVSGVFQRAASGKWVAKVTDSSSGH